MGGGSPALRLRDSFLGCNVRIDLAAQRLGDSLELGEASLKVFHDLLGDDLGRAQAVRVVASS